jgi:hypothetical protein
MSPSSIGYVVERLGEIAAMGDDGVEGIDDFVEGGDVVADRCRR